MYVWHGNDWILFWLNVVKCKLRIVSQHYTLYYAYINVFDRFTISNSTKMLRLRSDEHDSGFYTYIICIYYTGFSKRTDENTKRDDETTENIHNFAKRNCVDITLEMEQQKPFRWNAEKKWTQPTWFVCMNFDKNHKQFQFKYKTMAVI